MYDEAKLSTAAINLFIHYKTLVCGSLYIRILSRYTVSLILLNASLYNTYRSFIKKLHLSLVCGAFPVVLLEGESIKTDKYKKVKRTGIN